MSTRSIVNRAKLEAWASHFAEHKASGLTVADWCQQNNISKHSYFYWKRRLKDETVSQALPEIVPLAFSPVPVSVSNSQVLTPIQDQSCKGCTSCANCTIFSTDSCVCIHMHDITVELGPSASEELICRIIKAVRHA